MTLLRVVCLALIVLGMLISAFLLARYFAIVSGTSSDGIDVCRAVFGADCDATLRSPLSSQIGIPLAGWGIVYYGTLAALLVLGWALGDTFEPEATLAALAVAVLAVIASLALAVTMAVGWAPFCLMCAVVQLTNLALLFVLKAMTGQTLVQLIAALKTGGRYLLGERAAEPVLARWKVSGCVTAALVGIVFYQWVLIQTDRRRMAAESPLDPQQVIAEYESRPVVEIPVGEADPRLGPEDAPMQMVVFSSFQCPGCQTFAHTMSHLREDFDGQLTIIFKHFPLGKACNPDLKADLHPQSCAAARAAEAAQRQGKFWAFHDALFAEKLGVTDQTLERIAKKIGIDVAKFNTDRVGDATVAKVKTDIELGNRLGLDATPTVFLNGRPVDVLSLEALEPLIRHELEHIECEP